jgi:hypothetical protein
MYHTVKCNILIEKKYAPKSKYLLFWLIFMPVHMLIYFFYYIPFHAKDKIQYYKAYLKGLVDGIKSDIK